MPCHVGVGEAGSRRVTAATSRDLSRDLPRPLATSHSGVAQGARLTEGCRGRQWRALQRRPWVSAVPLPGASPVPTRCQPGASLVPAFCSSFGARGVVREARVGELRVDHGEQLLGLERLADVPVRGRGATVGARARAGVRVGVWGEGRGRRRRRRRGRRRWRTQGRGRGQGRGQRARVEGFGAGPRVRAMQPAR